jgi:hypothetical protein
MDIRGRKWREAEEDSIMRGFITYTLYQYYRDDQIKEDEMDGACNTRESDGKLIQYFGRKNQKRRYHLEDLDVDGRIKLERTLRKQSEWMWIGLF